MVKPLTIAHNCLWWIAWS